MQTTPISRLIGRCAPDLALPSVAGPTVSLADFRGWIVLFDFIRHLG